ncbi:MAG: helix-turn-helix domain-containing protein [Acidobacteria bacterium]|nr:helix-turn-helix domain-containing protein [Acidobacteriota bacterium]
MGSAASTRSVGVDAYVLDILMADLVGHDRMPSAFLVYLWLWSRASEDGSGGAVEASLRQISEGTGLSRRATQSALSRLKARELLSSTQETLTSTPIYTVRRPWRERG